MKATSPERPATTRDATWRFAIPDEAIVRDEDGALGTAVTAFMHLVRERRTWRVEHQDITIVEGRGPLQDAEGRRPGAAVASVVLLIDRLAPDFRRTFRWGVTG